MRIAFGSVLVLLVVLLAWRCLGRSEPAPRAPLVAPPESASEMQELARVPLFETRPSAAARRLEPAGSAAAIGSAADLPANAIHVRSSIGLPLPFLEVQVSDTDWRRLDLDRGRCELGSHTPPCLVRAPGHVAARASSAGEELVLEPDALLLLEASDLQRCTRWIRPSDARIGHAYGAPDWDETKMTPALRRAIAWGFVSSDRWACAVSSELVRAAVHSDPVELVIRWRDGRRADVHFDARAGTRAAWTVPCEDNAATADLDVHVVRPAAEAAGPATLRLWRVRDGSASARSEIEAWGHVVLYGREHYEETVRIPDGADSAHFESVPTGSRLSLFARDEQSAAYARLVFEHDGTARTLELRPGFEASGRVVSRSPSVPVTTLDWSWQFREGPGVVWGWHADAQALVIPPDGSFHLRGPSQSFVNPAMSLDPPAQFFLRLDAPGFEPFEGHYDTGGATRFDCGEIVLVPRRAEFELAPGHGLSPRAVRWFELKLSAAPEFRWTMRHATPTPDGGLAIFLARSEKEPTLFEASPGAPRALPESVSQRILLHVLLDGDDEPRAFERALDGRFVAVARRELDFELECRALPGDGESWFVGWQWHELWDTCEQVPAYELGRTVRARFSIPVEGATLFWSASGNPPRAGSEPGGTTSLEALPARLVLR